MPIQTPQWTDFLICPVCENGFELKTRLPISLACGHTVCKTCLANLQRSVCPFDQVLTSFYSECNITNYVSLSNYRVTCVLDLGR